MVFPAVMYWFESWTMKKAERQKLDDFDVPKMVLEKSLESLLDCKRIKWVDPNGNQSWIFIGRTDAESETPILWSPDVKTWLTGKDPDAGKDWRKEDKRTTRGDWMASLTWWTLRLSKLWELVMDKEAYALQSMGSQRVGLNWETELNWRTWPTKSKSLREAKRLVSQDTWCCS